LMYRDGEGVTKDNMKAIEWFQKAASQGHETAQFILKM
jgi:TPR repeat protein